MISWQVKQQIIDQTNIVEVVGEVVHDVVQVDLDAFAVECVAAARVDHLALRVHHVVVFQQTFTDTEVVFLYLLLGTFYGLAQHIVLQNLAFLETKLIHQAGDLLGSE